LWFYYDPVLMVRAGVGSIIDRFSRSRPSDVSWSISVIIGAKGDVVAALNLHEPFLMRKTVEFHLVLPTADETAIAHWREEYKKTSGINADTPPFLLPGFHAHSSADHTLFFGASKPVIPASTVYYESDNNGG